MFYLCLFLCPLDYSKSYERILINFGEVGRGPRTNRLDFGGDAGHVPNRIRRSWIRITIWIREFCKQIFGLIFLEGKV